MTLLFGHSTPCAQGIKAKNPAAAMIDAELMQRG
jgi:hypothetical protein